MKDKIILILIYILIGLEYFIQLHLSFQELEEKGCKYIQINEVQDDQ